MSTIRFKDFEINEYYYVIWCNDIIRFKVVDKILTVIDTNQITEELIVEYDDCCIESFYPNVHYIFNKKPPEWVKYLDFGLDEFCENFNNNTLTKSIENKMYSLLDNKYRRIYNLKKLLT